MLHHEQAPARIEQCFSIENSWPYHQASFVDLCVLDISRASGCLHEACIPILETCM